MTALHLDCGCWSSTLEPTIVLDVDDLRRSSATCRKHGRQPVALRIDLLQPVLGELADPTPRQLPDADYRAMAARIELERVGYSQA